MREISLPEIVSIVNVWLLYKRDAMEVGQKKMEMYDLLEFKSKVAENLCKCDKDIQRKKRGRPTSVGSVEDQIQKKKKSGPTRKHPDWNVRRDGVGHWPEIQDQRQRCGNPLCKGFTSTHNKNAKATFVSQ